MTTNQTLGIAELDEVLDSEDRAEMALLRLVGSVGLAVMVLGLALRLLG